MPADPDDNTCPWKIRDRDGRRHGVLPAGPSTFALVFRTPDTAVPAHPR